MFFRIWKSLSDLAPGDLLRGIIPSVVGKRHSNLHPEDVLCVSGYGNEWLHQ